MMEQRRIGSLDSVARSSVLEGSEGGMAAETVEIV
jgi:hypothetical protein